VSLLEEIAAQFDGDRLRRVEVPEWGKPKAPLVVFYKPMTLADLALVAQAEGESTNWHFQAARIVVLKACNAQGEKLFKMTDALALREKADPDVVIRLALKIKGGADLDAALKN